eukprot:TRINITY_DN6317_c0_g1_i1.p1 TRINITY_DN6317_c0_g1~~TRINITY_DN6317_c0_g1_i1.p1  ORF type:complete len:425 (+),score=46.03 TRINITY_DN6317_c0_g1_i1:25-1275(+)
MAAQANTICVVLVIVLTLASTLHGQQVMPNVVDLTTNFVLGWSLSTDNSSITFQLSVTASTPVWVGLGWHPVGAVTTGMTQADFAIAVFNGSKLTVSDYFANTNRNGFTRPLPDTTTPYPGGVDNIGSYSGMQAPMDTPSGTLVLTNVIFQRPLITGDTAADHPITPGSMIVIWAFGESNTFGYHHGNAGQILVDFYSGATTQSTDEAETLIQMHGGMMFIAFGIQLTFGAFVARYLRTNHRWWLTIHATSQLLGVATVLVALVLAIVSVSEEGESHFHGFHQVYGLLLVILLLCFPALTGVLAHWYLRGDLRRYRWIHVLAGYVTIILGYIQLYIGIHEYDALDALKTPYYILSVLFGLYLTVALVLETTRIVDGVHPLSSMLLRRTHEEIGERDDTAAASDYQNERIPLMQRNK